ncbi:uncharacterized protein BDR25DRAFT_387922 [Lindgomyces ingoldianus]|uniref:Uncharacterized protein n=1 Tax=Lindgomyces ingoldianus TaxID=673940 RepID=A0ACB6Q6P5_9PLEO|nr:uncharacterized protein BDR25DRAFT_387922 [Lindgomyces ingoldianus]KAF2462514.1 hypothetical protein BDR25DRAFT_387922 [Lindgomyces ingoldianus]
MVKSTDLGQKEERKGGRIQRDAQSRRTRPDPQQSQGDRPQTSTPQLRLTPENLRPYRKHIPYGIMAQETIKDATKDGLILERGQPLRTVIQASELDKIPLDTRICWLREAAEGTQYMHDNKIIHADVGCNNWVLVGEHLKIIDFEGCSIDGEDAGACYEWFSYKGPVISRKTDIFAFGCAIYEVMTGKLPYKELLEFENPMLRARELYSQNQFPEVEKIPLGSLMQGCWQGTLNSMREILQELEGVIAGSSPQE